MASEFEIRQKQKGGEAKRQKELKAKKRQQQISRIAKNRKRLEDAQKRLDALKNPKTALEKKQAKDNLGEVRRLEALIKELKKRLGMKADDSTDKKKNTKPMAKEQPNTKRGEGVDDAGPAGQEARKKETDEANKLIKKKDKDDKRAAPPPKSKKQGPSAGDIMGGKDGPQGPLGGEIDKQRKKKKRSMMGTNRFGAGKGRYGDIKPGVYKGQR